MLQPDHFKNTVDVYSQSAGFSRTIEILDGKTESLYKDFTDGIFRPVLHLQP